jgi:hypothetical protein
MKKLLIPLSVMAVSGPLLFGAVPAEAATKWSYRSTNLSASAEFSFAGTIDGFDGNVHIGYVSGTVSDEASVSITSWTCEEGSWPSYGYYDGHDGGSDPGYGGEDDGCTFEDSVQFSSYDGDAVVAVDRKLMSGSISGTMTAYSYDYEGGSSSGETAEVSISFTGVGATQTSTQYSRDKEYSYKSEQTTRSAVVSGTIGGFDLGTADSSGSLEATKYFERYNSK